MKMIECNYMCRCRYHDNKMEESVLFCYLRIYPFLWNQNVPFFNLMSYSVILLLYAKTHILFCFVQTILLNGTYISYASLFNHRTYIKGITAIKYDCMSEQKVIAIRTWMFREFAPRWLEENWAILRESSSTGSGNH